MAYAPIAFTLPQYEDYPNWWMKAYEQGTTTPLSIATDSTGGTLAAKIELNVDGFPVTAGAVRFIPFINGDYDLWLFPTAAEADANDTTNAIQLADNVNADPLSSTSVARDKRTGIEVSNTVDMTSATPTDIAGNSIDLQSGQVVYTSGYTTRGDGKAARYIVKTTAEATADGDTIDDITNFNLGNGNVAVAQNSESKFLTFDGTDEPLPDSTIQAAIETLSDIKPTTNISFSNKAVTSAGANTIYLVGDSITEGSNSDDYTKDSFAAIIAAAYNRKFRNTNVGFVNVKDLTGVGVTKHHTVTKSGWGGDTEDGSYFGGVYSGSTTASSFIEFSYHGKDLQIVYEIQAGGGTVDITIDGISFGSIDTSSGVASKAAFSSNFAVTNRGTHTVRIAKQADALPVNVIGINYVDDGTLDEAIVSNVGRASIRAIDIDDSIIDLYSASGAIVLALGVNDNGTSADQTTFRAKIKRFLDQSAANENQCIVCDFIFNGLISNPYKSIIRDEASKYPQFPYLDFAELWYADSTKNQAAGLLDVDGVHPTEVGHQMIAEAILSAMNMPAFKWDVLPIEDQDWSAPTLVNSWSNFGGLYNNAGYRIDRSGYVHLRGRLQSGTTTPFTTMFNLPVGYRPENREMMDSFSNGPVQAQIEILPNGDVQFVAGNNTFISLDGIVFKAV